MFTEHEERKDYSQMREAVNLTVKWFDAVDKMKQERRISSNVKTNISYASLIGNEFSDITTTLGSLEAKEISTNPDFAALIVKYLSDCKIDSTKTVGLILSGSFPALSISSLAAIQSLNAKAVIFSSLGASMYGANQSGATWIDIENYLRTKSNLKYQSDLVSLGGENDNGGGLSETGFQILKATASNYNIDLYIPHSIIESIEEKVAILLQNKIDLLINIGGNQTSFGECTHSLNIPNGLHKNFKTCLDRDRGIIIHLSEKGIPFINLLNIRRLAIENDISINPSAASLSSLYMQRKTKKTPIILSIIILNGLLILIRKPKDL